MKTLLLLCVLVIAGLPCVSGADGLGSPGLVTNWVEILRYVDAFSKTLDIDVPQPLTTNDITWFGTYRSGFDVVGLQISKRFAFGFNVRYHLVYDFIDYRHSMVALWREEDIKPLIRPSKITAEQAMEMAQQCLVKLGYTEDKLPRLLSPQGTSVEVEAAGRLAG
jgi:hypothetical protein